MSNDAVLAITETFKQCWRLFTNIRIPGTDISPASWAMFALFFVLFFKFVGLIIGDGAIDTSAGKTSDKPNRK